ncbi:MAG: hypothetical protein DRP80_00360 [Candidatus Omnitrophota bacterium]|nr:MAG: hypothetical protein DRP80_00360 [Candidatus Omnitrophota bacterium]
MVIGVNFPTNIGDTILALPALDALKENFPQAKVTAIASPKTRDLLFRNNFIDEVVLFDKKWGWREKMAFSFSLRKKFGLFIDLKNTFLPIVLAPKRRTPFLRISSQSTHKKDYYLSLIKNLTESSNGLVKSEVILEPQEKERWVKLFSGKDYLFIATCSASSLKQYPSSYLKEVVYQLKSKLKIVLLGREEDRNCYKGLFSKDIINLAGKTKIWEVFFLLKNYAKIFLGVDSSLLHIASYLNIPTVSIFGPTSEKLYGPYSENSLILKRENLACRPCGKAQCRFKAKECMRVEPQKIVEAVLKVSNVQH